MFNSNDKLVKGGDLFKFKPGLSNNFIQRYVELSTNAFRYFENYYKSLKGVPIVCFRKKIIMKCIPYKVNKTSYLKPGSKVFKQGVEDKLFDNMFEIVLVEDYETNCHYKEFNDESNNVKTIQLGGRRMTIDAINDPKARRQTMVNT